MHVEAIGKRQVRVADAGQQRLLHGGVHAGGDHLVRLDRLAGLDRVLLELADLVEYLLQLALVVAQGVLGLFHRDVAAADQGFGVGLADAALGVDDVVHVRLRHRRVVTLVVPAAAVAQHVDDDVLLELLPEVHGQPRHPDARLGVVAVDVEDRRADHFRDVGAVLRRPGVARRCGEPDLVVDDDVDRAAGAVPAQQRQVQRFGHHALAGERGVAVHHHRHDGEAVGPVALVQQVLLGATRPSSTGSTASRCDGLATSDT